MRKVYWYWSNRQDPNSWHLEGGSFWCPRWLQPAVFAVLRWLSH